jgi:DDE superfamily endonuclease
MDILNTHSLGSLYEAFPPKEARRLIQRLEVVHTPKHGSWLNMAEIELNVLTRQCLARRIPDKETLTNETAAWEKARNGKQAKIDWQFKTDDARTKLKHLYPKNQS